MGSGAKPIAAIAVLVLLAAGIALWLLWSPNRVTVRNASGHDVQSVTLALTSLDGRWSLTRRFDVLGAGKAVSVRHGQNDLASELHFTIDGRAVRHHEPHIDLWRGEVWMLKIGADGVVSSGFSGEVVPPAPGDAQYGPVYTGQLLGDRVCWATGTSGARFRWVLTDERFEFREAGQPLPPELLETMLGADASAELIEGAWDFTNGTLRFSQISADGVGGWPDASLRPFRTPVVRMMIGDVQYVLGGHVGPSAPQPVE